MTKLEQAIIFAVNAHRGVKRKGKERPYILHPLEVLTIVGSLTDDEEVLAAAVLHDTLEDTDVTRRNLVAVFGERVAALVDSESENKREEYPAESTWRLRKQETLDHLKGASKDVKLICLGDKLANIRELARDYESLGDALWERFNQKDKSMHCWYYGSLLEILAEEFGDIPAVREYGSLMRKVFGDCISA